MPTPPSLPPTLGDSDVEDIVLTARGHERLRLLNDLLDLATTRELVDGPDGYPVEDLDSMDDR